MHAKMLNIARISAARQLQEEKRRKRLNTNIKGWPKIRNIILERDNYICRICGDWENLNVHHIDYLRSNNASTNLVTLCQSCHKAIHLENYKPWQYYDYPAPWGKVE